MWTVDTIINVIYRFIMIFIGLVVLWKNTRKVVRTLDGEAPQYLLEPIDC
jgi:hypothetical protein